MKKIFTLLLVSIVTVSVASAQSRGFGGGKHDVGYTINSKQAAIKQINREYDYKIAAVKMNRRLNRWEKSKQISRLENMRDAEISRVQFRFEKDNRHFDDHGYANSKRNKW